MVLPAGYEGRIDVSCTRNLPTHYMIFAIHEERQLIGRYIDVSTDFNRTQSLQELGHIARVSHNHVTPDALHATKSQYTPGHAARRSQSTALAVVSRDQCREIPRGAIFSSRCP